jgi:acyl dehydratase
LKVLPFSDLPTAKGIDLGRSEWLEISQTRIDEFASATGDDQWIHVDRPRAELGPYGATIAHGFLTLSLVPLLMRDLWRLDGSGMGINYGINRVRFLSPVLVGSRVRLHASIADTAERKDGSFQVTFALTIEIENSDRPALVAETLAVYVPTDQR